MKSVIEIVCCVCNKHMGIKDGEGIFGISHSICDKCFKIQMEKDDELCKEHI